MLPQMSHRIRTQYHQLPPRQLQYLGTWKMPNRKITRKKWFLSEPIRCHKQWNTHTLYYTTQASSNSTTEVFGTRTNSQDRRRKAVAPRSRSNLKLPVVQSRNADSARTAHVSATRLLKWSHCEVWKMHSGCVKYFYNVRVWMIVTKRKVLYMHTLPHCLFLWAVYWYL